MSRKRRVPDGLNGRESILRHNASIALRNHGWGKKEGKPEKFNIPILLDWMGLDMDSAKDQRKVYSQVILYWRKRFTDWFKSMEFEGKIPEGANRHEIWDIVLENFNQNDKYLFFSKRKSTTDCFYVQPKLGQMERLDFGRLDKQMKSIVTILQEMEKTGDRQLISSGKKVSGLLKDQQKIGKKYLNGHWSENE